jgi:hypothetical protein
MKKLLMIALVAGGLTFASAATSNAGVSIGIGLGFPVGFSYGYPYYGYGYPYAYGYPYGYGYAPYYNSVVIGRPHYYWSHGHRVYYSPRGHVRHHRVYHR